MSALETSEADRLIARIGDRVRRARADIRLSRRALAERSDVSERYLAMLERGQGNISVALLARVAEALCLSPAALIAEDEDDETARFAGRFGRADATLRRRAMAVLEESEDERAGRVCLIGLRGAGKSTLGRMAADELGLRFIELGEEIEALAGLPVAEVIALYGQEGYRELERRALDRVADAHENLVLAVAGGIVESAETYELLLRRFHTVWLKAAPDDHMQRVRRQGDERPMIGHPRAMDELRAILDRRTEKYAEADIAIDTTAKDPAAASAELATAIRLLAGRVT